MHEVSRPTAEQPPQTLLAGKLTAPLLQPGICAAEVPVFIGLQAAGLLAMCLFETGREDERGAWCIRFRPPCRACWTL
jgi:hypothetical protein